MATDKSEATKGQNRCPKKKVDITIHKKMESLTIISEKLGIEEAKLNAAIEEAKISVLTETDKKTLLDNHGSESFKQGKQAGVNMLFRNFKKSYERNSDNLTAKAFAEAQGFEDVLVNVNKLHDETLQSKLAEIKGNYEGNVDERVGALQEKYTSLEQTYTNEKTALQKVIEAEKQQREQIINEYNGKFTHLKTDYLLQGEFSALNFDVPADIVARGNDAIADYNKVMRQNTMSLFKNNYGVEFNETEPYFIDKSTGEKIVDNLQNPAKLPDIMKSFVERNFLNVVSNRNGGRGGDDQYKKNGGLSGINSAEKMAKYAESKGVEKGTRAFAELYNEVKSANPNANF